MIDVIIAGGGPAGSLSAYRLAKKGVSVCIIEKAIYPRAKTCGGGLSQKTINHIPFDLSPVIDTKPEGGLIAFNGKPQVKVKAQNVAQLVRRETFDHFLVEQAVNAGAKLQQGESILNIEENNGLIRLQTSRRTYQSRFLIGADGVNSITAHQLGLLTHRKTGIALEAEFSIPGSMLEDYGPYAVFDFGALPLGYGWVFPKRGAVSIGVFHARPGKYPDIKKDFDRYLSFQPHLPEFGVKNLHGHPIPLGGQKMPRHKGRTLLVGDAANLADPWLGEGIFYAAKSAEMASSVVSDCLNSGSADLSPYSQAINATLIPQFHYAHLLAEMIFRNPYFSTRLVSKSPLVQNLVFGIISGNTSFKDAFTGLLLNMPKIISEVRRYK